MRTPNTECIVCKKPLYRRPSDLKKHSNSCCAGCRSEFYKTKAPSENLKLGREKGTNHLTGIKKSQAQKDKAKVAMIEWCAKNKENILERSKKMRAENHYNWKGGASNLNQAIRRLHESRKWQIAVKKRDKNCVLCSSEKNLEAHHVKSLSSLIDELSIKTIDEARNCGALWDISNGVTLCIKCHYQLENRTYNGN